MKLFVTADVTIVEFHHLTSLEWAVLSILKEFPDSPPSLAQATEELSLKETVFLATAVNTLVEAGALELRSEKERSFDLDCFKLTEQGQGFLREDGWEFGASDRIIEQMAIEWPSARIQVGERISPTNKHVGPAPEEVESRLKLKSVEGYLNLRSAAPLRVKDMFVTNVET